MLCGDDFETIGFANFTIDCGDNLVYGLTWSGNIFEYNIESNEMMQVGNILPQGIEIYGATTVNEYMASTCTLEELPEVECVLNVSEEFASNLEIYPNPVTDVLKVQNLNYSQDIFYTLFSIEGKKLAQGILTTEIDLSHFSSGIYLMNIYNKSKTVIATKKIVKN